MAGGMLTPADRGTAVLACVTRRAGTGEVIHTVSAGAPIGARGGGAVIHVVFAVSPREASLASAQVGVAEVHTPGTIRTGGRAAEIHLLLTVEAREAHGAVAGVASISVVRTPSPIEARTICTSHGTQLTDLAIEARGTGARVAVLKVRAAPSIPAGAGSTLIHLQLTVGTCVPRSTGACVAPLACVGTGGSIPAWLMVSAVVQVLVAEEAPPAFLAVTLPGLLTGTMETAWVSDTLIAVTALPANSALALPWLVTISVLLVTPWQTDGFSAVLAFPARVAHLLPSLSAGEVAKGIIPGSAEHRATFSVVVFITHKTVRVAEVCAAATVKVLRPLFPHSQVPLRGQAADEPFWVFCCKVIGRICVEGFNDQREGSWPGEAEGESDGVAKGGVDACAVGQAEGVDPQHRRDGAAVGAGRLWGHAGLVVLEAYAEEGPAGARRARAPAAAVAVPQQPLLVDELLQLQLKDAGAPDLAQQGRDHGEGQRAPTAHGTAGSPGSPRVSSFPSSSKTQECRASLREPSSAGGKASLQV